MKRTLSLALFVAAVGCGNKKSEPAAGSGSGSGSGSAAPTGPRMSQQPLPALPAVEQAPDDKRDQKVALGNALFFEKKLSGAGDLACYSCHQNEDGTGGHDPTAIGSGGKKQPRHAPTMWNVGLWKGAFYWDGRAKTLEDNIKGAWGGGNMGAGVPAPAPPEENLAKLDKVAGTVSALAEYKPLFAAAFGKGPYKAQQVIDAIAAYMRTIRCDDTAYDKFAAGQKDALSEQQQRGLDIFGGKGGCAVCHTPPMFSSAAQVDGGQYFNMGIGTDAPEPDIGRMKVTNAETDWASFKPPSLRNVTKSPPYFHNGSVANLDEAVKIMASGGIANKNKSPLLEDRKLSDAERADLISFLGGLECGGKLAPPAPKNETPAKPPETGKAGKKPNK